MPASFPARLAALPLHRRVRLAAIAVLVAGLLAALCVLVAAGTPDDSDGASIRIVGGQAYSEPQDNRSAEMQQLARLGGQASVQTYRFDSWLSSLWHGPRLAATLAVLSAVVAGLCWHIAGLMEEDVEPPPPPTPPSP